MIKSDERINFLYGHFCDDEIVNGDLTEAFEKLVNLANKSETEPLWAPASWVQWRHICSAAAGAIAAATVVTTDAAAAGPEFVELTWGRS